LIGYIITLLPVIHLNIIQEYSTITYSNTGDLDRIGWLNHPAKGNHISNYSFIPSHWAAIGWGVVSFRSTSLTESQAYMYSRIPLGDHSPQTTIPPLRPQSIIPNFLLCFTQWKNPIMRPFPYSNLRPQIVVPYSYVKLSLHLFQRVCQELEIFIWHK
jgi:hypothetical protein